MLPKEIKEKRIALNLTQSQLAEIFGVERNTIARWEQGRIVPQAVGMLKLAFQSLEIENRLENSNLETLRDGLSEKVNKSRIRHAKNKAEFQKI